MYNFIGVVVILLPFYNILTLGDNFPHSFLGFKMNTTRDISVSYSDRAIAFQNLYDKTPITEINEGYIDTPLAKLGDLLKDVKTEAVESEQFVLYKIFYQVITALDLTDYLDKNFRKGNKGTSWCCWYRAKFVDIVTTFIKTDESVWLNGKFLSWQNPIKKDKQDMEYVKAFYQRKLKKRDKRGFCIMSISLKEWRELRQILIKYAKCASTTFGKKATWFWCLDYFFNNLETFKNEHKYKAMELSEVLKVVNSKPKADEPLYIVGRIIRQRMRNTFKNISMGKYVHFHTKFIPLYVHTGINVRLGSYKFVVMSEAQIRAFIKLYDLFYQFKQQLKLNRNGVMMDKGVRDMAISSLKQFLKAKEYYIKRYDCLYVEGKTYKGNSLEAYISDWD